MDELKLPITLPEGWKAEYRWPNYKNIVIVECSQGAVTINLKIRAFGLGIGAVNRNIPGKYMGRGWQERLYNDAVAALQACTERY
jgi:hypothetical protein